MATLHRAGGPAGNRVDLQTKLLYGIGEIAITAKMALFGLFVLFFYNTVLGLPALWVGIASASGLLLDAAVDPYIGYRSDVSESRYGRRHVFMALGTMTMGTSFWMIWAPPQGLPPVATFFWLLVAMLAFRFTSALFRIPYLSLGAELSEDYHERTSIVGIRSFFGLLGSLSAASLSFYFFFPNVTPGVDPKLSYEGYPRMGLAFALVMTASAILAIAGTASRRRRLRVGKGPPPGFARFLSGFRLALENRAFRKVWLSFSLFFAAVVLNSTVSVHFFTWYVEITDSVVLGRLQAVFYIAALGGVGFWVLLARRSEKRSLYVLAMAALAGLMGSAPLVFGVDSVFGTGDPRPAFALYGLAGFLASALWVIPASMVADIADDDALETGQRREGLFFGILNFGEKVAAGVAVLIGGGLMDYFAALSPGQTTQSPETISRIAWIYGGAPAVLLLVAVACVSGYGLDRDAVASIQIRLRERADASPDYSI